MDNLKNSIKKIFPWLIVLLVGYVVYHQFAHYATSVPLAGDDWGYAYNGANGNAFKLAYDMYFSWSGRFFAELWGFLVAPNKELWNVLNPWLFVGVTVLIMVIFGKKEYALANGAIVLFSIFSVSTTLRIETYAWIMGSTYVTALLALLIHILCLQQLVFNTKYKPLWITLSSFACFFTGLAMENAAAICVLSNLFAFGYLWFIKDKDKAKTLLLPLIISIIAIIILRASPGANYRLTVDNVEFNQLSIFAKIGINWKNFLYYTFFDSPWTVCLLSVLMSLVTGFKALKTHKAIDIISTFYFMLGIVIALSPNLYNASGIEALKMLFDVLYSRSAVIIVTCYYTIYFILCITQFLQFENKQVGISAIFTLLMAGCANGVMLISPIFGARSSIYTVYLLIGLCLLVLHELKELPMLVIAGLCIIIAYKKITYLELVYDQVAYRSEERAIQIEYYQTHLDEDIHITRYRKNTVHSADIEYGDDYHFKMFKLYYGFDLDRNVIFESLPSEVQ